MPKRKASALVEPVATEELKGAAIALPDISKLPAPVLNEAGPSSLRTSTPKRKASTKAANAISSMDQDSTMQNGYDDEPMSDLTPLHSETEQPDGAELEEEEEKPKKKQRKPRAPKVIVYDIPPVETKETTFKGRLGYACLNTVLRNKKPAKDAIFCSRTLRIATIKEKGEDYMKELGKQNMRDLAQMIQWNEDNHIRFMRMSSEMFPFASHPEYGYDLEYAQEELTAAGNLAKKYGHRLTTHPGQFTQLGSPRQQVVDNAFRDLKYHAEMIDRMGLDKDSVMIIHGGGTFNDKAATLERIKANYQLLPDNVKARLVLENDEMCYNVDDLMPLCEELNIPLVFDYHHDWIFPSAQTPAELMPRILATWERKGIKPKQHLSEPRPGAVTVMERRAHSDRIKELPAALPEDMDLMLEAKDKEQAVLQCYRVFQLHPTIHDNLRPPAEVETLHTNGRKSHKKKKSDAAAEEDEEGLEDPEAAGATPKKSPKKARKTPAKKKDDGDAVDGEQEDVKPSTKRKPKAKAAKTEDGEASPSAPKKRRTAKSKVKDALNEETHPQAADELSHVKVEPQPPHLDDAAACLTGLAPLPEGFVAVDHNIHAPESVPVEALKQE